MDEQMHKTEAAPKAENKLNSIAAAGKNRTLMACLAYVLFFIPMITGDSKRDEFVKYHTKQGFALFIVCMAIYIVGWVVPFFRWMPVMSLLNLGTFVLFIIGLVNAASDKKQPLPIIGSLGDWLKI
jgi:uncharacterized membrane protein